MSRAIHSLELRSFRNYKHFSLAHLSPSFNIGAVVVFFFLIISRSTILEERPILFLFYIGMVSAKVTNCLIVAHMTKSPVDFLDQYLCGLIALFLNQYFLYNIIKKAKIFCFLRKFKFHSQNAHPYAVHNEV